MCICLCETWKHYLAVGLLGPCSGCHPVLDTVVLLALETLRTNFVIYKDVFQKAIFILFEKTYLKQMSNLIL